jgi:tRNA (cytidine56-2'-O)-methyltransferase
MLTDVKDEKIRATLSEVVQNWGGTFFFQIGTSFKKAMKCWKAEGGMVVHLTAYGENIEASNVMERIHAAGRDLLVIVGSRKVPAEFFSREISDFNVAVGNQPHSECSSLAVFLDRFFNGKELVNEFENARLEIIPQKHGKKVLSRGRA